ncbi:MAG TPA: zf-TFIIB domain-containing protein [Kofleriaceae bacterium]|nr:zf-TFIIB domain-containing protein [Kofleriaceae bacterium]
MYRDGERTRCPVCEDAALDVVCFAGLPRHGCAGCGGAWVDEADLWRLFVELGLVADEPFGPVVEAASPRACVRCGAAMVRERAPGEAPVLELDVCAEHGAWFDGGELPAAIERLAMEALLRENPLLSPRRYESGVVGVIDWLVHQRWRRPTRTRGQR